MEPLDSTPSPAKIQERRSWADSRWVYQIAWLLPVGASVIVAVCQLVFPTWFGRVENWLFAPHQVGHLEIPEIMGVGLLAALCIAAVILNQHADEYAPWRLISYLFVIFAWTVISIITGARIFDVVVLLAFALFAPKFMNSVTLI